MKKSKGLNKSMNLMYMQQIDRLKFDMDNLDEMLENQDGLIEWAYIIHDKDLNESGELVEPHLHVSMRFKTQRTARSVAKIFNDLEQSVQYFKGNYKNMYSYLVHKTSNSLDKYQYNYENVVSSFDYYEMMEKIELSIGNNMKAFIKESLDMYAEQRIDYDDLERRIGVLEVAKNMNLIKNIDVSIGKKKHRDFVNYMKEHNLSKKVYYLYGATGVGKTRLAKAYAKEIGKTFYVTDDNNDPFQTYNFERVIILDELRPNDMSYNNLLKLLDPYNFESASKSRYSNKILTAEVIIITSPLSPIDFFDSLRVQQSIVNFKDGNEQLFRRLTVSELTDEEIIHKIYKNDSRKYVKKSSTPNPFYDPATVRTQKVQADLSAFDEFDQVADKIRKGTLDDN